jgi:hypothetical protein
MGQFIINELFYKLVNPLSIQWRCIMLSHSFEDLAQTFRVLIEAQFKLGQLITIDRPEAVGNIETSVNAMLNAFSNLYDLMQQQLDSPVDWYATPELCVVLAIRNARHHNNANRIRTIYNYHVQNSSSPSDTSKYFYVNFPANPNEEGGGFFDVGISWGDFSLLLEMPRSQSRLRSSARELIRNYLNADQFEADAAAVGLSNEDIFINFVPLATNAGIALSPYIRDHIQAASTEATAFLSHFENVAPAITRNHDSEEIEFMLPA